MGLPEAQAEQLAVLEKAVELAPDNLDALNSLACARALQRTGDALEPARKAAELAPWSAPILDTYAAALASTGQCVQALGMQKRAIDMLGDRASAKEHAPYTRRLAVYEAGCKELLGTTND